MTTISPIIDSGKIVEVLFDNAEEIPNDVYLNMMNMMKRYHEHGDNERQIRNYLKGIDPIILNKFDEFIAKRNCCVITISCDNYSNCVNKFNGFIVGIIIFISALGSLIYFIHKNTTIKSP